MFEHNDGEYHEDHPEHPSAVGDNRITSLCLARKRGEGVHFYGPVDRIIVNQIKGGVVRLVIHAPLSTKVLRSEHLIELPQTVEVGA